jgi:lactate dehydrogenase-like 2-hydroxyacid dehydrogenase
VDSLPDRPRIFIPQPIPLDALDRLRRIGEVDLFDHHDRRITREEVLEGVSGKEILYAMGDIPYDKEVIAAAADLRLIAAMHVAATFVDIPAATRRGIPVTGVPNTLAETTGEFTFALLVSTAWRIPEADGFLREGRWTQNQSEAFLGTRMQGKTVGLVGLGQVGAGVARRCRGMDMRVIYTKRNRLPAEEEAVLGVEFKELDDLLAESDFVVLTPILTPDTNGLISREKLGLLRPDAILINTSRGPVVDEEALEVALREGRLRGAGLDVYEREIPEPDYGPSAGLKELPNVVLTPHIGTAARETRAEMADRTVDNIEAFLAGERPPDLLNPELYGEAPRQSERIG